MSFPRDGSGPRRGEPAGYSVHDRRWWSRDGDVAAEAGAAVHKPTFIEALEGQLAERDQRLGELAARVRDGERELEQAKARIEREARREVERRLRDAIAGWLIALDDLDRAIAAGRAGGEHGALLAGVEHARAGLLARLAADGVRRLEPTGERFDPRFHQAIARVPVDAEARDGRVVETAQPGYAIGDDCLRAAKVAVGAYDSRSR